MSTLPTFPIDVDPIGVYRRMTLAEVRGLLDQVLSGVDLGMYDQRIVEWIKGCDQPTIVTLSSLIVRAPACDEARDLDSMNTL